MCLLSILKIGHLTGIYKKKIYELIELIQLHIPPLSILSLSDNHVAVELTILIIHSFAAIFILLSFASMPEWFSIQLPKQMQLRFGLPDTEILKPPIGKGSISQKILKNVHAGSIINVKRGTSCKKNKFWNNCYSAKF